MATKKGGTSNSKQQYKNLDFLKAGDLPAHGTVEMKILGNARTHNGDYGLKINMDVELKGKKFAFGIKPTNPGLKVIINSLAAGEKILVERGEYNGNEYVQVCGVDDNVPF